MILRKNNKLSIEIQECQKVKENAQKSHKTWTKSAKNAKKVPKNNKKYKTNLKSQFKNKKSSIIYIKRLTKIFCKFITHWYLIKTQLIETNIIP